MEFLLEGNDAVRQGGDLYDAGTTCMPCTHIYVIPIKCFLQTLSAVRVLGFIMKDESLLPDEGRCCDTCEVIIRQGEPCSSGVAESSEDKVVGKVARVRLAVDCGTESHHPFILSVISRP